MDGIFRWKDEFEYVCNTTGSAMVVMMLLLISWDSKLAS